MEERRRIRLRLLKERVRRSVRGGEKDDARRVRCETRDDGRSSGRRGGPDEEHRTDSLQPGVERFRHREVARYDLDCRRQPGRRSATERAHRHARGQQLVDHETPDAPGGAGHKDGMHATHPTAFVETSNSHLFTSTPMG